LAAAAVTDVAAVEGDRARGPAIQVLGLGPNKRIGQRGVQLATTQTVFRFDIYGPSMGAF
jgi:hypothetical protein